MSNGLCRMNGTTQPNELLSPTTSAELDIVKARLRAAWGSRDAGIVGDTLPLVSLSLCRAVDMCPGSKVLGVVAGYDNCADGRVEVDGLSIQLTDADAEVLPFPDATFDAVLSPFGVMFAANHVRAAHELMRVCRRHGRIGLANWTPGGFMGRLLAVLDAHAVPPHAATPAAQWGDERYLEYLFRDSACDLHTTYRNVIFRFGSAELFVDALRCQHRPVRTAVASLSAEAQRWLSQDVFRLIDDFNVSTTSTAVVLSEYVEVVVLKK